MTNRQGLPLSTDRQKMAPAKRQAGGAAMKTIDAGEDFRMGRVVGRLFEALFANAATFLALAALLSLPTLLLSLYLTADLTRSMGLTPAGTFVPGQMGHFFVVTGTSMLVYVVFGFLLQ